MVRRDGEDPPDDLRRVAALSRRPDRVSEVAPKMTTEFRMTDTDAGFLTLEGMALCTVGARWRLSEMPDCPTAE